MITQNVDGFTFGVDRYPDWFVEIDKQGLVTYLTNNSTGELAGALIASKGEMVNVKIGDVLLSLAGRVIAIPKKAAERYIR